MRLQSHGLDPLYDKILIRHLFSFSAVDLFPTFRELKYWLGECKKQTEVCEFVYKLIILQNCQKVQ
jgi:hypothetical protein